MTKGLDGHRNIHMRLDERLPFLTDFFFAAAAAALQACTILYDTKEAAGARTTVTHVLWRCILIAMELQSGHGAFFHHLY